MSADIIGGNLGLLIEQMGQKAVRGALDVMRSEAEKVAQKARDYAPVDHGNLEQAIKVQDAGGGRNDLGQFARKSVEIYVDTGMAIPERPGKTVGDYAYEIHEHMTPVGPLQRGPQSEDKDAGRNVVGGGYMTRAANDMEKEVLAAVAAAIRGAF